jgi:hypothetical protein
MEHNLSQNPMLPKGYIRNLKVALLAKKYSWLIKPGASLYVYKGQLFDLILMHFNLDHLDTLNSKTPSFVLFLFQLLFRPFDHQILK